MIAEQLEMDDLRQLAMRKFDEQVRNRPRVEHLTSRIKVAYHFPNPHCHGLWPAMAAAMKRHLERTPDADAVEDAVKDAVRMYPTNSRLGRNPQQKNLSILVICHPFHPLLSHAQS
jgi:hypothetical protein